MSRSRTTVLLAAALLAGLAARPLCAAEDEWKVLFDGKDLSAWQTPATSSPGTGWTISEGALVRQERSGYFWSKDRYGDFVLELEFKTEGNSGIFIRTDKPGDPVQTGIEIQVDRPANAPGKHSTGCLYDLLAPTKVADKAGQWNAISITAQGSKISVVLNGEKIIDADLDQWTEANKNPDGSRNKFNTALKDFKREGFIGFQDHGAKVAYRNVRIKCLD